MEEENKTEKENTVEVEKNEETGNVDTQTTETSEGKAEKTYTQEQLDKSVKEALKKQLPAKEEMKAFKEWKESQKTAEQKQSEKEIELQNTLNEKQSILNENITLKAGVNADDVDYVVYKVSKIEGDFEDNLKDFLKDNPKYLKGAVEQKATGISSGKSIDTKENGVEAILKAKHPELFKN